MAIKLFYTDDWILLKDGDTTVFAGHSVSAYELKNILEEITMEPVSFKEISVEEMEML